MDYKSWLFALLAIGLVALMNQAGTGCVLADEQQAPPKLFDFDHYKSAFGKTYSSMLEELARKRLFFSRAFLAFVAGVKYKFRRMSYYLAVNEMSDWSQEELQRTANKLIARQRATKDAGVEKKEEGANEKDPLEDTPEFVPDENEDVEAEIASLIETHANAPGFEELKRELDSRGHARHRRDAPPPPLPPRDFSFDRLIKTEEPEPESPKKVASVPSNNPNYEPFELPSFGLGHEEVRWVHVAKNDSRSFIEQATGYLGWFGWLVQQPEEDQDIEVPWPKDEVFLDLRSRNCTLPPRSQGRCGSCYAFAAATIMEYHFCMKTGKLVALSEQYLMDCGKAHFPEELDGCEGGEDMAIAKFVHNFGLELARRFPYMARETHCPYEEGVDAKKMGFIRMPLAVGAFIPEDKWAEVLEYGPLWVSVTACKDFSQYGGGVLSAAKCYSFDYHAMVLMGHGRQDGQEYWLLRNSFGPRWGERGYIRVAKKAARGIMELEAIAFGSSDGVDYPAKPSIQAPVPLESLATYPLDRLRNLVL